jgi:ketosteroid isomerase-like protein
MPTTLVHRIARSLALALLVTGCARGAARTSAARAPADDAAHAARARAAITAAARELSERYVRGDARGIAALYLEDDGMLLPPGGGIVRGREAMVRAWTLPPGRRMLEHRTTADSIVVVGPVAYDWGRFQHRSVDAAGVERTATGLYVIVWRETAPGVWRMHVDIWNNAPAPPPAPAR